jgi:dTDP-4-amino-4,6-dideoxygalactose transaminase
MTEMQSALGRVVLKKVDRLVERRRAHASRLNAVLADVPAIRITVPPPEVEHAYYKYYAFVRPELLREGWTRDRIMAAVTAEGVPCFSGSCSEIYNEKAFDGNGLRPSRPLPVARELGDTALMLMVHPTLADTDIHDAVRALERVLTAASL